MFKIHNNSEDLVILLHEIYGINRFMENIANTLASSGYDVICPDLCGLEKPFDYSDQEAAYAHFKDNVGFERAAEIAIDYARRYRSGYRHLFLLGFSIGATTSWICSRENGLFDGVIGCYGSRIRDYTNILPSCPVLLIFPSIEYSFDATSFVRCFTKSNVEIHVLDGHHGFADPYSPTYSKVSAQKAFVLLANFLKNLHL